jgi:hypothetical protein
MIDQILKNCPEGMELYSPAFGEVKFKEVKPDGCIRCQTSTESFVLFYSDGSYSKYGECVLFPYKEQRNWDNFLIPFKDGDIIIRNEINLGGKQCNIAIFSNYNANTINKMTVHCQINGVNEFKHRMSIDHRDWRLATQKECEEFMTRLNREGYAFIDGKLQEIFKKGDIVAMYNETYNCTHIAIFDKYSSDYKHCNVSILINAQGELVVPSPLHNWRTKDVRPATLEEITTFMNKLHKEGYLYDNGKVVKHKFNKATLKPYDKVLIKASEYGIWYPTLVSYVSSSGKVYVMCQSDPVDYVIPFEGHEHLVEEHNDPDPFYITWD